MKTKKTRLAVIFIALLLFLSAGLTACGEKETEKTEPQMATSEPAEQPDPSEPGQSMKQITLNIFAAASLTNCMQDIGTKFMEKNPHILTQFNFESSGTLQTQISEGAPCDVFVSAAQKQMNSLEEAGLIDKETRGDLLINKVVMIVPKGSELGLKSFEDVKEDKVEGVALGEASVPVGQYAEEIYKHLGLWDAIQPKIRFGNNVRVVLGFVEAGEVSCGVVYKTDAAISDKVEVVAEAPEGSHKPVIYPAAVIRDSKEKDAAGLFLEFLGTPEAAAIFEQYGFTMAGK